MINIDCYHYISRPGICQLDITKHVEFHVVQTGMSILEFSKSRQLNEVWCKRCWTWPLQLYLWLFSYWGYGSPNQKTSKNYHQVIHLNSSNEWYELKPKNTAYVGKILLIVITPRVDRICLTRWIPGGCSPLISQLWFQVW